MKEKMSMEDIEALEALMKSKLGATLTPTGAGDLKDSIEVIGAILSGNGDNVAIMIEEIEEPDVDGEVSENAWVFKVSVDMEYPVPVYIKIPISAIPTTINVSKIVIQHYTEDGAFIEEITPEIKGDYLVFVVTQFSIFVADEPTPGPTPTPSKGSGGSGTGSARVVDGNTTYVPPQSGDGDGDGSEDGDGDGTGSASEPDNTTKPTTPTTPKDEGSSSTLKWILVIGAVIVIIAVAFFLYQRNKKN